jgi:hypothetical protein
MEVIATLRITSITITPNPDYFNSATSRSTLNRFFFIQNLPSDFA